MRYPFIGGHRNGQVLDVDATDFAVVTYRESSPLADYWSPEDRDAERRREQYRREKFAVYVEHPRGSIKYPAGGIERCEWIVYVHGRVEDAPPPFWVMVGHAPVRRTAETAHVGLPFAPRPQTILASTLFEMGASWV